MKYKRVLLIHPNRDISDQLDEQLRMTATTNRRKLVIDRERNMDDARPRVEDEKYNLIITHLHLPETSTTAPDRKPRGLDLIRLLRRLGKSTPAILITLVAPDLELREEISKVGGITDIDETGYSIGKVVELATKLLSGERQEDRLSITFVQQPESELWSCQVGGETFDGLAKFSDTTMRRLCTSSHNVGAIREYPEWREELKIIGEELTDTLVGSNPSLAKRLAAAIEDVGGIENTRLCFKASQAAHGIALEAVVEPPHQEVLVPGYQPPQGQEVPFWMLKAPVYRRMDVVNVPRLRLPLFEDRREDLNFLIIEAPTSGDVVLDGTTSLSLPEISNVGRECSGLEKWLNLNHGVLGNGEVCRVAVANLEPGQSYEQYLRSKLEEKEWQIVHYSGHSYYQQPAQNTGAGPGTGYIFLPGERIRPIPVGIFATWIKDAQLVFLTSCHSSEENFVFEMARNLVPAVIGFRWDLEDDIASEFVTDWFYPNLFKLRSIEAAFQQARATAHELYPEEPIWAAPMLILHEQRGRVAA